MPRRDRIVIGASAGGVKALTSLVSAESLSEGQSEMLEVALWSAVRALEGHMVHTVVPITDGDGSSVNRLFIYSERA